MLNKPLLPIFWTALLGLTYSCLVETAVESFPVQQEATLTIAAARSFFESGPIALTRSENESAGALTLGAFEPDWKSALPSMRQDLEAIDIPVCGDYIYRLPVGHGSLGRELGLRLTHRLIVLRQKTTGDMCPYLLFYLPDSTFAAANLLQTAELCETLLSCAEKASFTGPHSMFVPTARPLRHSATMKAWPALRHFSSMNAIRLRRTSHGSA